MIQDKQSGSHSQDSVDACSQRFYRLVELLSLVWRWGGRQGGWPQTILHAMNNSVYACLVYVFGFLSQIVLLCRPGIELAFDWKVSSRVSLDIFLCGLDIRLAFFCTCSL